VSFIVVLYNVKIYMLIMSHNGMASVKTVYGKRLRAVFQWTNVTKIYRLELCIERAQLFQVSVWQFILM